MNNFFLFNEALNTTTVSELELGISNLNSILAARNNISDNIFKHISIWEFNTGHGFLIDFYFSVVSKETQRIVPKIFEAINDYPIYITNEIQFDTLFPHDCNGFLGINFSTTIIPVNRQIIDAAAYIQFKNNCAIAQAFATIEDFWINRAVLFPNLIFCEVVWDQIQHLSINDPRFKLIKDKLIRLNDFVGRWTEGIFDFNSCGLDCSPDTPTRISNTLALRTFTCPSIGERVFSLHIKWSYGREFFRMYFYPDESNKNIYIGYIGPKDQIGF